MIAQVARDRDRQNEWLHPQVAILSETTPGLRLSTPGWINITPRSLVGINSTELLLELCMEKLRTRIQPFSQRIRLFVERYFNFMTQQIEAQAHLLRTDEIIKLSDWVFSSWLPLPHAQILLPQNNDAEHMKFAEVDIVFWTGTSLIGLQIENTGFVPKSKRENLARLKLSHPDIMLITIDHQSWDAKSEDFPEKIFDSEFLQFWQDVILPCGPALTSLPFGTDFLNVRSLK